MSNNKQQPASVQEKVLEIGSRLKTAPSERLINSVFAAELSHQTHLFEALGLVDIAHTLCAIEVHTIPAKEGYELLAHLVKLQSRPETFSMTPARGDIYTNREAWLAERTDATGWLGAGRARREAITTAFILITRHTLLEFTETLIDLCRTMVQQAEEYRLSLMPDYTYLQAAQPTTFGHYLLGFTYPILRDLDRLESLLTRLNLSPVGCGSSNGSRLLQERHRLADLLGFNGLIAHARDAMWQADLFIETASILTTCSISLSRLAEDLQVYSTQEFALVELDDSHARASKIMPQKKNPFALTHIRGVANKTIGLLTSVATAARTPSGQPDNRLLIYGDLPEAMQTVNDAAALMTEVLQAIVFNTDRGEALVNSGWALSTDLAESLVLECGLDFRSAHHLVAFLASEYRSKSIRELDYENLMQAAVTVLGRPIALTEQQFKAALDASLALQARTQPGGTATDSMSSMIAECREQLAKHLQKKQANTIYFASKQRELLEWAMKAIGNDKP